MSLPKLLVGEGLIQGYDFITILLRYYYPTGVPTELGW